MAHFIGIGDESSYITLTSGNYAVQHYEMSTAQVSLQEVATREIRDRFRQAEYGAVTDQIRLYIEGSTPADAQAKFNAIERYLQRAVRAVNVPTAPEVSIRVQMDSDSIEWKARIFYGTLQPDRDMFTTLPQKKIEATLTIVRDVFRGPLTQLSLSNTHGSGTAVTVYNHEDSGHKNSATVTSTILGTLPAPAKLRLKNTSGGSVSFKNVFFGINSHSTPSLFTHVIEAEDSLFGSTVASSSSSGGEHQTLSVSESANISATYAWLPDTDFFDRAKGESFMMVARFKGTPPTNTLIMPVIGAYDSPLFFNTWIGKEILVSDFEELVNLGPLALPGPNWVPGHNYSYGFGIGARSLSGSKTLTLDYIQFFPADNWAQMRQSTSLLMTNNEYVVCDDVEREYMYQKATGDTELLPVFQKTGPRLTFEPGVTNKITVLWEDLDDANIDWTCQLEAWYEPRRLTI